MRCCALVPVYNHHLHLDALVSALAGQGLPILLVDDGSDAPTRAVLDGLAEWPGVTLLRLPDNAGKGAACMAGFRAAAARGFTHALQIDADGQHAAADAGRLLAIARKHPDALISGLPKYDPSVPRARFYGRYLTHALIWLDTLSFALRDSMCGFRVYPLAPCIRLMDQARLGRRMDFDTDIMTRLYWAGTPSLFVETPVRYPADGVSHYRMLRDNLRMVSLHVRLLGGMLRRLPRLARGALARHRGAHWARIDERGSLGATRMIGWLDATLGRTVTMWFLQPVMLYFLLVHRRARFASRQYFRHLGVSPSFANRYRQMRDFTWAVLDKARAWRTPQRIELDCSASLPLLPALRAGRGALFISAHFGNVEVARAFALRVPEFRITALVHTQNATHIDQVLKDASAAYGLRLLQVTDLGADTAVLLKARIDRGEIVVIAGDRPPIGPDARTVRVAFLGGTAPFAIGPYVLAHVLECPVYAFFCVREGNAYRLVLEPLAERVALPRRGRVDALRTAAGRFAASLERQVRQHPYQWHNFFRFWPAAGDAEMRS